MRRLLSLIVFFSALGITAAGFSLDTLRQRYSTYTYWCSPEKLYLHLDRTCFAAGETIWFKGYLKNACSTSTLDPSNFIYVELLKEDGTVVSRVKIKRDGDGFPGSMFVRDELSSGNYILRAYTLWQLNLSQDYMFSQKIRVIGSGKRTVNKTAAADSIDVTFYPEGGRYFSGQVSRIAFKVMDSHGRSVETSGEIEDDCGTSLIMVSTIHDGMGLINFIPQEGRKYRFRDRSGQVFPLPDTSTEGGMVGISKVKDYFIIHTFCVSGGGCTVLVRDSDNLIPIAHVPSDGKSHSFALDRNNFFNPGLNHLLLMDDNGRLLSERLFFMSGASKLPKCSFKAECPSSDRGLVRGRIELKDEDGKPLDASLSLAVVKGAFTRYIQDDNLLSYMGLSSELKGRINNPSWYFDSNVPQREREDCLDLLLMIQGWRYYELDKIMDRNSGNFSIRYLREYVQSLKGRIERPFGKKIPENFIFTVIVPKLHFNRFVSVAKADHFLMDSLNFQENTPFLISTTRTGIGADFIPKWSGDIFAAPFKHPVAPGYAGETTAEEKTPIFMESVWTDTLQAAVVTAKEDDFFGSGINSRRVDADDFKTYANYTLVEYLVMKNPSLEYNGEEMYNRRYRGGGGIYTDSLDEEEESSGSIMFDGDTDGRGLVKLVENNSVIEWWTYEQTMMEDVEALSVSTISDSFYNAEGGVVMIKVFPGSHGINHRNESLLYFVPLGYQKPSRFYSPRYDLGDPYDVMDWRNTLYWNPSVQTSEGSADIEFCGTDKMDLPYIVTVQGYTSDGRPVSYRVNIQ